ncbi:MAG: DNA polymerase III subunit epsilon [Paracoccaceae bacterium]|nr:DNA polymerase III subunit epsilon [Paracoccaceae bacterium]
MREIVLDTETTGLNPDNGDRIVEIGAVELLNHVPTGRTYHQYINPERSMPKEAEAVHGLSDEFLADKPVFAAIVDAFLEFIAEDPLVIHNASFDMRFINAELLKTGRQPLPMARAIDTLEIARKRYPGAQNSLDALCRRFSVDNSGREKHGALLDSELLAEVYLELMGGRQPGFGLDTGAGRDTSSETGQGSWRAPPRPRPLPPRLSADEQARHAEFIKSMGENALWSKFGQS